MRRWHTVTVAMVLCVAVACDTRPPTRPPTVAEKPHAAPVILLTGFEPFGVHDFNTSWDSIRGLDDLAMGGKQIKTLRLPVVWGEASDMLSDAIKKYNPEAVICFGMGTRHIQVELTARNERRTFKDNKRLLPPSPLIHDGGPATIETRLPVAEIQAVLREAGLVCNLSKDAGGYLCNEVFYTCMAEAGAREIAIAGFIHVPVVYPESADFVGFEAAIRAVVETCITKTVAAK